MARPSIPADTIPTTFKLLAASLIVLLITILGILYPSDLSISPSSAAGFLAFLVLSVLGDSFPLNVSMGYARIGISGTIYWALIVIFGPFLASLCAVLSFLISDLLVLRRSIYKVLFNSAQVGLSTAFGGIIFLTIQDSPGLTVSFSFFVAFAAAVVTYWLFNTWIVSFAAYILYGSKPHRYWRQNFQWVFIYELTSAPIALAVAYAYIHLWLVGLLLLALPTLMVRLAYSQYLDLKRTYRETVRTLVKIIEMHDPYTAGHSDRVATYSRQLCEALRLSPGKTEKIEMAAYLHDLGKIHLDLTGIVRKAGKLTEEERRMVRLHSVMSADLASQVSYFKGEIEEMIRHHHENWDGSGYPHGRKGPEIPLGARIILIADAFDAMTTSRVYRDALDLDRVKNEFRKFAGIQFDPTLVPVFLDECVGAGSNIISQPLDEPLEGQRARAHEVGGKDVSVSPISRRAMM